MAGEILASVWIAVLQIRLVALTTPTDKLADWASYVRPSAMAHWPTVTSSRGTASGTGSFSLVLTLSRTNMRLWSRATIWAAARAPLGSVTRIEAGCWTKLNALEMTRPSSLTARPVVGPVPTSSLPTFSRPPSVSIFTTDGATAETAWRMAISSSSSRSCAATGCATEIPRARQQITNKYQAPRRNARHEFSELALITNDQ